MKKKFIIINNNKSKIKIVKLTIKENKKYTR